MRIWITLCLIVVAAGCSGKKDGSPSAKGPQMDHGGHAPEAKPTEKKHGSHGGHEKMPMNMPTPRKLIVGTDPAQPQAGSTTNFVLQIQDDDGTPVKKFDLLHEKLVHLIVVREGLDEFAHLHPKVDAMGLITIDFVFPKSGKYRLYADHQPKGASPGLATGEVVVDGDDKPAAALEPNSSNEVTVGELTARVSIKPGDEETAVRFQLVDATGQPIGDLQPYLGAMGHLVIISADGQEYVHAHPVSEAKTAPDGVVEFAAHFPTSGIYKAWGQFQRDGSVFTVPFVMEHKADKPKPHAGGH